ncbi:hypothetical protein C7451_106171 [Blastomonas natatoria]|uniref:Uncharacterized protein n=1 Tax=Blastomonas natatoria TaxID=34015 RepID=A0A2V3V2V7_9SPHN|nr:hypothetical protein [Blastomonas natatoria]PXW76007.1 hypothetical protein C7451_106171 [Blastomonas natatoria]
MSRREWTLIFNCGHEGCTERATYRYPTRRDLVSSYESKNYSNGRWRCVRHTRPNEVLGIDNLATCHETVLEERSYGKFWGNSGFIHGPGFKAFADDFPPGTKIIVRAEVVLPDARKSGSVAS